MIVNGTIIRREYILHGVEEFFVTLVTLVLAHQNIELINQFRFNLKPRNTQ